MTDYNADIVRLIKESKAPFSDKEALRRHVSELNVRVDGESPDPQTSRLLEIKADLESGKPLSEILEGCAKPLNDRYIPIAGSALNR